MKVSSSPSSRSPSPSHRAPGPTSGPQNLHASLPCRLSGLEGALTLQRVIASGSYGKVFLSKTSDGRLRAAKCIPLTIRPPLIGESFDDSPPENEVTIMKLVKHSNVIRLYDSNIIDGRLWISMEYASYGNVTSYLHSEQRKTLSEDELATLALSVLRGLKCIHKRSVIHRDVKPTNILVTHEGKIKLGDLGTACMTETQRYSVQGTFQYLAPEIFQYNGYDNKVDIWALGMSLLELAQGYNPFQSEHIARVLFHLVDSNTAPSLEDPSSHSAQFIDFLSKCLTIKPDDRPSASTLLKHPFLKKAAKVFPLKGSSSKAKASFDGETLLPSDGSSSNSNSSASSSTSSSHSSSANSRSLGFDPSRLQGKADAVMTSPSSTFHIPAKLIQARA